MESVELDLADPESIKRVADHLISAYPSLNVVVHNAGIMQIDDASTAIDDDLITWP